MCPMSNVSNVQCIQRSMCPMCPVSNVQCPSQVLQPTCHWKWVGCTIPLKQDNFTLEASWDFNRACTHEWVQLLDKWVYREPLFNWQTFHTFIGCDATAAWRAPPISTFCAANFNIQLWPLPRTDFSHIERFIFVSCTFLHQYWFNCAVSISN